MNRFSKDIDTIDNLLGEALRMFANTFSQMIGAIILISVSGARYPMPAHVLITQLMRRIDRRSLVPRGHFLRAPRLLLHGDLLSFQRARTQGQLSISRLTVGPLLTFPAEIGFYPPIVGLLSLLRVSVWTCDDPRIWRDGKVSRRE